MCAQADHCLSAADHLFFVISRVGFLVSSMPMSDNWNALRQTAFEPESFMSKAFTTADFCTRSSLHRRPFAPETLVHHKQKPFTPERFDTSRFFLQTTSNTRRGLLHHKPFTAEAPLQNTIGKRTRSASLERRWSKDTHIQHNYVMLSHNILRQWQKLTLHHRHQFCSFFFVALSLSLPLSLTLSVTFCFRDRSLGASCLSNSMIFTSP